MKTLNDKYKYKNKAEIQNRNILKIIKFSKEN